jgi:hypothetical protein
LQDLPFPAIRYECLCLLRRSPTLESTHDFLINAIGSYGTQASFTIATFHFLEMFLHELEGCVDYSVSFRAIDEFTKHVGFMNDEWMRLANIQDDGIRVLLDPVVEFLAVRHFCLLSD